MKKIYIAAPLFSEAERKYNEHLDKFLSELEFDTFLPQRDGHELSELLANGTSKSNAMKKIFERDTGEIKNSDIVVFIMDGRVPDEGACMEIGYAFANGKECIGLKTDSRTLISDLDNPMLVGALKNRIAKNLSELKDYLYRIK
jgi:nucleoside 2-deoxyribosyltransferase